MVQHTEYTLGPVEIIVNNAGVMYYTLMKNLKEEEWEKQIDVNCKVRYTLMRDDVKSSQILINTKRIFYF